MGRTPCDKRSASKWILSPDLNGWQELDGSHQWKMAEALFLLRKGNYVVDHPSSTICLYLPFFFLIFSFYFSKWLCHKKSCNVLSWVCNEKVRNIKHHVIATVKGKEEIAKCSIITNSKCGKHKPSNYGWKYKSVLYDINRETKKRKRTGAVISKVQKWDSDPQGD